MNITLRILSPPPPFFFFSPTLTISAAAATVWNGGCAYHQVRTIDLVFDWAKLAPEGVQPDGIETAVAAAAAAGGVIKAAMEEDIHSID